MQKIKIILVFMLLVSSGGIADAAATYTSPIDNIVSTSAVWGTTDGRIQYSGTVTFHYRGVDWDYYGADAEKALDGVFPIYCLTIEFKGVLKNGKKAANFQGFELIPRENLDQLYSVLFNFDKNTYVTMDIAEIANVTYNDGESVHGAMIPTQKIYTDGGKCVIEWTEPDKDGVKERLSFDKSVLLTIQSVLRGRTETLSPLF